MNGREHPAITLLHTMGGLQMGGVGNVALRNIRRLEENGFRNHICYLRPRHDLADDFAGQGIRTTYLAYTGLHSIPRVILDLVRLVRGLDVDIVHTNHKIDHLLAGLAGRVCGVPVIRTLHYVLVQEEHRDRGWRARAERWLSRLMNRRLTDHFIAVSRAAAEAHAAFSDLDEHPLTVIHPGLPVESWLEPPSAADLVRRRTELELPDGEPVLVNVGRLRPVKAQERLVALMARVAERHPGARLLILGEGPRRTALEATIRDRGLDGHIRLLGQRTDVREILAISDLFVATSEREGFGLAVVEAMLAGLPVVCTHTRAFTEIVESGTTGYLVADEEDLARRVLELLERPELREEMGRRGRELAARRFDLTTSVRRLETVYQRLLQRSPAAGGGT